MGVPAGESGRGCFSTMEEITGGFGCDTVIRGKGFEIERSTIVEATSAFGADVGGVGGAFLSSADTPFLEALKRETFFVL